MKKYVYTLFIDLAAAFYHVSRDLRFKPVCQRLTPTSNRKLIQLMELLYLHTTTTLAQTSNDNFQLSMGAQQDGPEFPQLFNLFMDFFM